MNSIIQNEDVFGPEIVPTIAVVALGTGFQETPETQAAHRAWVAIGERLGHHG
jgi:hypothetical protein